MIIIIVCIFHVFHIMDLKCLIIRSQSDSIRSQNDSTFTQTVFTFAFKIILDCFIFNLLIFLLRMNFALRFLSGHLMPVSECSRFGNLPVARVLGKLGTQEVNYQQNVETYLVNPVRTILLKFNPVLTV